MTKNQRHIKNPRLIIIDTLARIKPRQGKKSGTAYDLDNELLNKLQTIAIQKNITIAFVTHMSKQSTDYSWDRIQGSVGMQGMTDAMWLIDRGDTSKNASITGRGRDIEDFEYAVKWNEDKYQYDFEGNLQIVEMNENRREVLDANGIKSSSVEDKKKNNTDTKDDKDPLKEIRKKMAEDYQKQCNVWLMILKSGKAKNMERTHLNKR